MPENEELMDKETVEQETAEDAEKPKKKVASIRLCFFTHSAANSIISLPGPLTVRPVVAGIRRGNLFKYILGFTSPLI